MTMDVKMVRSPMNFGRRAETMTARIYVGTYAKYNNGSIAGAWLNLVDYADKDEFLMACAKLHKDEADPELMFQDYEGFPSGFYSESSVSDEIWEWLELDEDDQELLAVYHKHIDQSGDIESARNALIGHGYNNEAQWAAEWLDASGALKDVPEHLQNYIDFQAYARDAQMGGDIIFVRHDGDLLVFNNN